MSKPVIFTVFFTVTDRFQPKKHNREWEGMGVILLGLGWDRISPQFFRGIGMGQDFFLWEWDGRGLNMHSRVTL